MPAMRWFLVFLLIMLAGAAAAPAHEMIAQNAPAPSRASSGAQGGSPGSTGDPVTLRPTLLPDGSKQFDLTAKIVPWEVTKNTTIDAWTYNGIVPGPILRVREGDRVVILLHNELPEPTVIHWHGLPVPNSMDGVPGMTQQAVAPHATFTYTFRATRPGTYMYHTHFNDLDQLDRGLYGAFIVDEKVPVAKVAHDFTIVLSGWRIKNDAENYYSINGKSYPQTTSLDVKRGETFRLRYINISATETHTMHLHGHLQRVIARDGNPVTSKDVENTILLGPGQTVDALVTADADPGTWMLHCHILDHMTNNKVMPGGLITAIHYVGTPDTLAKMQDAMGGMSMGTRPALSWWKTVLLGGFAGLTILLGLPVAKLRDVKPQLLAMLNSIAVGVLFFLLFDVIKQASEPIQGALHNATTGGGNANDFIALILIFVIGIGFGLIGLTYATKAFMRSAKGLGPDHPLALAMLIALGIGAHNFAEGLAIGQSSATGQVQLAIMLIIGFGLHNMTEGFGIAAPLANQGVSWRFLLLAGIVGGAPTFFGTIIGYSFVSPQLSVLFLTLAAGAIIFVINEMLHVTRRVGFAETAVVGLAIGFLIAYGTDLIIAAAGA